MGVTRVNLRASLLPYENTSSLIRERNGCGRDSPCAGVPTADRAEYPDRKRGRSHHWRKQRPASRRCTHRRGRRRLVERGHGELSSACIRASRAGRSRGECVGARPASCGRGDAAVSTGPSYRGPSSGEGRASACRSSQPAGGDRAARASWPPPSRPSSSSFARLLAPASEAHVVFERWIRIQAMTMAPHAVSAARTFRARAFL